METQEITAILMASPKLKAKEIAKKLGKDQKEINALLHRNLQAFIQDGEFRWSVKETDVINVVFKGKWVDCKLFERSLKISGCLLTSPCQSIIFLVTKDCKILLEAAARLLALCNQLVLSKKNVTIDFNSSVLTMTYFNRIGFIDQLNPLVTVFPARPKVSAANKYRGNSSNVVEFAAIEVGKLDKNIPRLLKDQFVVHAGNKYTIAAFTVFSELIQNIFDHSNTPISGFAALQKYDYPKPHIQTIVSDSGDGIVGTLWPVLGKHYPELAAQYRADDPKSGALLLKHVLENGQITQCGCGKGSGRGLGLKSSQACAVTYSADLSVRQETFELMLSYRGGKLHHSGYTLGMPKIWGTHVCFDFYLD